MKLPETDQEMIEFLHQLDSGELKTPTSPPHPKLIMEMIRLKERGENLANAVRSSQTLLVSNRRIIEPVDERIRRCMTQNEMAIRMWMGDEKVDAMIAALS